MALRSVPGGRGKGEGPRRRKPSPMMDRYMNVLLKSLPARSRRQIAQRMAKNLDQEITVSTVDNVLNYMREHARELNIEVHHAPRGPNPSRTDRFYALPVERSDIVLTPQEKAAYEAGAAGTLSYGHTTLERLSTMWLARANNSEKRKELQVLRSLARRAENFAEDIAEMIATLDEANGS